MERAKKIVIDASVAVKWFNPEKYSDIADSMKNKHIKGIIRLVSPTLMVFEVANALRYNPDFGLSNVKDAVRDLLDLQVSLVNPYTTLMERAVELAFKYGVTIYDACYVALAKDIGSIAYTADEKLLEKISGEEPLKNLSEFKC